MKNDWFPYAVLGAAGVGLIVWVAIATPTKDKESGYNDKVITESKKCLDAGMDYHITYSGFDGHPIILCSKPSGTK